jgi:hypothetical protein
MGYAFDGDEPVPDAVRRITDEQVERVVSTLEQVHPAKADLIGELRATGAG